MAAEAKRACSSCVESPWLLGLGTVCSPSDSASSTFPVRPTVRSAARLPVDCLLVLWSFYLVLPSDICLLTLDFCLLIGLCLIAAQTLAILVAALFSCTLSLLPHSPRIPFLSRILCG